MTYDYIIIGAGSAGCAAASELVKTGRSVLLLEAGGADASPWIRIPAGAMRAVETYDWGYHSEPDPSRAGTSEGWPRGKVLGGSSSINGTIFIRGAARDFDAWAQACGGKGGWSWAEVLPLFKQLETSDQDNAFRGCEGPLNVRSVKRPHSVTRKFVESSIAAGFPFNRDYNSGEHHGVSYLQMTQKRGFRRSAATSFIRPLRRHPKLHLQLNALVSKIVIEKGVARRVEFDSPLGSHSVTAPQIVLCAGAINTPKLLMLSGVGDPNHLRSKGVELLVDRPQVGRNLAEHPIVRMRYRSKEPTYNLTEGPLQKIGFGLDFLRYGEGPIANLFEAIAFLKSSDREAAANLQVIFNAMGWTQQTDGEWLFAPYPAFMLSISNSYPRSRGRIELADADPGSDPVIRLPLFDDERDLEALVSGIEQVRSILARPPISEVIACEDEPGLNIADRADIRDYVRRTATVRYHPIGTCRMGADDQSVVDPDLNVRGVANLWVADASIMPSHLSCNTNAPSILVGFKFGREHGADAGRLQRAREL